MSVEPESHAGQLREQLDRLLRQARDNERLMRRLQLFELKLIEAGNLPELAQALLTDYRQAFALDSVTLVLVDSGYEHRRTLADAGIAPEGFAGLQFVDEPRALEHRLQLRGAPALGRFEAARHGYFFPAQSPGSVALLPLMRSNRLRGSLNLGSADERRFAPGMATDFMERLAAIVAICLENVANQERLRQLGMVDPLTGAYNRRYFDQRLYEEVTRALRSGQPLCCMMLDVDHFKRINDVYGHGAGDAVLRELTAQIKEQLRTSDVMARYGGEEFAVLLAQTEIGGALAIAERIRQAVVAAPFALEGGAELKVTLSLGVAALATGGEPGASIAALVAAADAAMYRAKKGGRNRVCASGPDQAQTN